MRRRILDALTGRAAPSPTESGPDTGVPPQLRAAVTEDLAARLRARQLIAIDRLTGPVATVNAVNAAALVFVLYLDGQLTAWALGWGAAAAATSAWLVALRHLRRRGRPEPERVSRRALRRLIRRIALFGLFWAVPGVTFLPGLDGFSLAFATATLTGMIAGSALVFYPVPMAVASFCVPVTLAAIGGLLPVHGLPAAGGIVIASMFAMLAWRAVARHSDMFQTEFLTRIELENRNRLIGDLLEDTRLELVGRQRIEEGRIAEAGRLEAVGVLTAGIAHEFNNLLTTMRGNAELLGHDGRSEPDLVDAIVRATERGAAQVQQLLSVAQKQSLKPETVEMDRFFAALRRVVVPALGPDFRLTTEVAAGTGLVRVDQFHFQAALVNLIFNARDATSGGGPIALACRPATMAELAGIDGPGVAISVTDAGVGMDEATRQRAIDPFFTTKGRATGTGLGLSSAAGFARQSGGDLILRSAPGQGTTVTMVLPAVAADGGTPAGDAAPPMRAAGPARILLVEDAADVRDVAARMLESHGHDVQAVETAEAALAALERGAAVDLVLTDILLGGPMSGLQLARAVRRAHPGVKLAFISASSPVRLGSEGRTMEGLLQKPFSARELAAHVDAALAAASRPGPRSGTDAGPGSERGTGSGPEPTG